jgi:alkylation response protein AidB-like acyl-CoA dehydrogenase
MPITKGEAISAGAFTEPDHGSDITSLRTTAVRDEKGYVINGVKTFISNGRIADFVIVLCQTNPEAMPPYRGQSTFIVDKGSKGFEATELGDKMGIRMTSTTEMSFDQVHILQESLVGSLNKGFYQVLEFFDESRVIVAAQGLGIAQERLIGHRLCKEEKQFGQSLSIFRSPSINWLTWLPKLKQQDVWCIKRVGISTRKDRA